LQACAGETVCLVGPSGCGKSTTLRLVAGLDRPDAGRIRIGARDVLDLPPQDRDVAMVFQGFALYPHLTVQEILSFPLEMRRVPAALRKRRVAEVVELLGLAALVNRRPGQLSGGEQQRVAMGRAIVRRPQVFLFDEPLSNLDAALRSELRTELGRLLRQLSVTALYVTHDQAEAMTLASRIAVLRSGVLEQLATPERIYAEPASTFVATFFGSPSMNLLEVEREGARVVLEGVSWPAPEGPERLLLGVRPEHVRVTSPAGEPATSDPPDPLASAPPMRGSVVAFETHGADSHVELRLAGGATLRARVPGFVRYRADTAVDVRLDARHFRWFSRDTGRAL
jgi:multiple sugar transport system ATP-binding protein